MVSYSFHIFFIEGKILLSLITKKTITGHFAAGSCSSFWVDFGLIVLNLFICSLLAWILRKGYSEPKKKKKGCFLPSRSSKVQRCPIDHNKSAFHFQRQESFLSVRLIQVFDNRPLINTFKHRNKSWEFVSAANYEKHLFCELMVASCCR